MNNEEMNELMQTIQAAMAPALSMQAAQTQADMLLQYVSVVEGCNRLMHSQRPIELDDSLSKIRDYALRKAVELVSLPKPSAV